MAGDQAAGCVGLCSLTGADVCEVWRLYVRPDFCGRGIGRTLADAATAAARDMGHRRVYLHTLLETMARAMEIYSRAGFTEIGPYQETLIAGAVYFALDLHAAA